MIKIGMMFSERYEILEKIGTGGMSDVYKAKDHKLNRPVAVKVLKQEFSENANFVSKFRTEAQAAAGLMHSNIVNVYDVGEEDGIHYIVMELVEGMTLKKYIEKKGLLTVKEAVSIAIQVSLGIEAAHNNHIIHRDIKPQNIMISKEGRVKVTDFGIAKAATSNTISSNVMGSVHYTSPEQARGGYSDAKSDIYSLGITLFEMLTGRVPFNGDTTVSIAIKHIQDPMPSPKDFVEDIPVSVEKIVLKCTQKSPALRYQTMSELVSDLKQSLITPDVDFVETPDISLDGATRMTDKDVSEVRSQTDRMYSREIDLTRSSSGNARTGKSPSDDEFVYQGRNASRSGQGARNGQGSDSGRSMVRSNGNGAASSKGIRVKEEEPEDKNPILEKMTTILMIIIAIAIGCVALYVAGRVLGVFPLGGEEEGVETELLTQSPAITSQPEETKITPIVSSDGKTKVPDVSADHNLTQAEATKALVDLGFQVDVEKKNSEDVPKGYVISQTPAAGQEAAIGSTVTLLISDGTDTQTVVVPSITGYTQDAAETALNALGLVLGSVEEGYSDEYPAGTVFYQSYTAGGSVAVGTIVDIKVSSGPKPRSYSCDMTVMAPQDPEYAGTEAIVMLVGTDNNIYYNTTTNVFPITINVSGIRDVSSGAIVINYNVAVTTTGYDENGVEIPVTNVETRSTTQAVVFTEEN